MDIEVQQKIHQLVALPTDTQKGGDSTNQVYWLRGGGNIPTPTEVETPSSPTLPEPLSSGSNSSCCSISESSRRVHTPQQNEVTAQMNMSQLSPAIKNTPPSDLSVHPMNPNVVLSPILTRPVRKPFMRIPNAEEDGDYATLRDLPLVTLPEETEPVDIHEISSSSDSSGVDSGFGSGNQRQNILPIQSRSSPLIAPNRDLCNPYGYVKPKMTTFASLPQPGKSSHVPPMQLQHNAQQRSPFNSLPLAHMQRYVFVKRCLLVYPF